VTALVEWVWTLFAGAGVVAQIFLMRDTWGDRRALRLLRIENGRRDLVKSHIRSGVIAVAMHLLFFFAGFTALLEENPQESIPLDRSMRIVALCAGQLLLVLNGSLDLRARRAARARARSDRRSA
jgi:hypothetical protein